MTNQTKMKKQMKRKIELALQKLSDELPVEYAIELESILTFSISLEDFKKFKEIITEKEKQIELVYGKQTRLTIEFINSLKDSRIIQKNEKKRRK